MTDTDVHVTLRIKRKGFEVSTEGTISTISPQLDALSAFVSLISDKLGVESEEDISEPGSQVSVSASDTAVSTAEVPAIKPSRSTQENLQALFSTPWGRTPRSLGEVVKALEVNAVPDRVPSISTSLIRLVQRGELRRIDKEGKWMYFRIQASE